MADEEQTFSPTEAQANRTRMQGGGVGQREMDLQRDPNRFQTATDPGRTEPFDTDLEAGPEPDRPVEPRTFEKEAADPRFGETEPAVDPRDLGEKDTPENDWGDPLGDEDMAYGSNHTRRPITTEAERGQGPKTRARTKDIINRKG